MQAAIGFTIDRTTKTVVSTEHIADLATQESVQVNNFINPNDIRQDKDDTNKGTKSKERFSSEEKHDDIEPTKSTSTDDARTETDVTVASIDAADVITNRYSEVLSTEGFSADTTNFDSQTITSDILTPTESSTPPNEYDVTVDDLSVSSINITNIENLNTTTDPSHIKKENISLSSIGPSIIGTEVNNVKDPPNINDQIAIDTRSLNNLNDSSTLLNDNSTLDNTNHMDIKTINTQTPPTAALDTPGSKPEGGKLGTNETDTSQKDLFIAEQKVIQAFNQITTESTSEEFTSTDEERVLTLKGSSLGNKKQNNMVEAETRQTTLSIPSLENLGEELISKNNQRPRLRDLELSMATEGMLASELIGNTQQETATVVSKRAGFLDYSKKSITNDYDGGTAEDSTRPRHEATSNYAEATDVESRGITKLTAYESRTLVSFI